MSRLVICKDCGREREHEAFGLCKECYNHDYYVKNRDDEISRVIQYQQRNPEKKREADRRYWERHKGRI